MALDMQKLKDKLEGKRTKRGFIRLEKGETVIRIVPLEGGDLNKSYFMHYNVGYSPGFLCPKRNFSEDCPICSFANHLWQEGTDESKAAARQIFAKERFYSPVLVRGEEAESIRWWSYSKDTSDFLIKLVMNPDYGDITDEETGTDLLVTITQKEGDRFPRPSIQPRRKSSKMCDGMTKEQCKIFLLNIPDLTELLDRKTATEIKALLDEYCLSKNNGEEVSKVEMEKYNSKKQEQPKDSQKTSEKPSTTDIDAAFAELLGEE